METTNDIRTVTYGLIDSAIAFSILTVCLLIFIFFYLLFFKTKSRRNQRLGDPFTTLVSEISLCETEEERAQVFAQPYVQAIQRTYLRKKRRRVYMLNALIQFNKSIHGAAAENTKWLYETLDLKRDSLQQLASPKWHKKAAAIQQLAEMDQKDCITKIYRYTNHTNYYIRSAAQVAVVKLTGVKGLRFLNVTNQPITHWQQLCLLQQLPSYAEIQAEKLQAWLSSENVTVVEVALKLVKAYMIHEAYEGLIQCLQHSDVFIRTEAINVLRDMPKADSLALLKTHYTTAERPERIAILQFIQYNGSFDDVCFLETLVETTDSLLKNAVLKTIGELCPNWEAKSELPFKNIQKSIPVA